MYASGYEAMYFLIILFSIMFAILTVTTGGSQVVLSMLCILVSSCFVAVFVLQYWLNYGMPRDDLALQGE